MCFHLAVSLSTCAHTNGLNQLEKLLSEFKRREKYISEMGDSDLLPIVRKNQVQTDQPQQM